MVAAGTKEMNGASLLSFGDDKANEESGGACSADRGRIV